MPLSPDSYAVPLGSVVLVTGANGYIASHIVDVLLGLGFRVRGTVRAPKPWLDAFFAGRYGPGRYESVVVPDFDGQTAESTAALDAAVRGVGGIMHTASDVSMGTDAERIISGTRRATTNVLAAAERAGSASVRRVVLTSSSSAAFIPQPGVSGVTIDGNSYNDAVVEAALARTAPEAIRGFVVYAASKTEGERSAWQWMKEHKPSFVFNTVLPNTTFGKILVPEHQPGSTMNFVRNFFKGDFLAIQLLPPQYYVNVVDVARLHVAGLLDPSAQSERIFAYANDFNWTDVLAILHRLRPNQTFCNPPANELRDLTLVAPRARAEELLKQVFARDAWISLEESLAEGIADLP